MSDSEELLALLFDASRSFGGVGLLSFITVAMTGWYREWSRMKIYAGLSLCWLAGCASSAMAQLGNRLGYLEQGEPTPDFFGLWVFIGILGALAIGYGEGIRAIKLRRALQDAQDNLGSSDQSVVEEIGQASHTARGAGGFGSAGRG